MTTIAWRGRILAADTQMTMSDDSKVFCRKLFVVGKGCLAVAGDVQDEWRFKKWFLAGENLDKWDTGGKKKLKFEAIYIDQWKDVWWYNEGPEKVAVEHPFFTIGIGGPYALTAMQLGHSAKEAVEIAASMTASTNGVIDSYDSQTGKITYGKRPGTTPTTQIQESTVRQGRKT